LCLFLGLQSASFSHLDTLPSAKLTRNGKPFTLIYIIEHDLNMTWLEKQTFIEKDLKAMTGDVTKELLDDLMPQIRLAALENSGIAAVDIRNLNYRVKARFTFQQKKQQLRQNLSE